MSDWDKIISFSNSKQGGAIQFILVCVILLIMFGSQFRNQMGGGGKQRGGDSKYWSGLLAILMFALLVMGSVFAFGGKNIKI
jgi:hypothetical protein